MASRISGAVAKEFGTLFREGALGAIPDGELLARFAAGRGPSAEAAFGALVDRHGPMVLGVCRRVLADAHDAEDAFQATFLVLARRAGSVGRPDRLGNWLYGVALRTARKARAGAERRRRREQPIEDLDAPAAGPHPAEADLRRVLDEEVGALPAAFRAPIVLCYLEGRSTEEAARFLGCPRGTVLSRLARGRARLRERLARRDLAPSVVPGALAFGTRAGVPLRLLDSTVRAATRVAAAGTATAGAVPAAVAVLTEGVILTMTLTKWTTAATAAIMLGLAASGAVVLARYQPPGEQPVTQAGRAPTEAELDRLVGAAWARRDEGDETGFTRVVKAVEDAVRARRQAIQAEGTRSELARFDAKYDEQLSALRRTDVRGEALRARAQREREAEVRRTLREAVAVAQKAGAPFDQSQVLQHIATAQARAGDKEAARETFRLAARLGRAATQADPRGGAAETLLVLNAEAQAEAGFVPDAIETAKTIANPDRVAQALGKVALIQGRSGDAEGALKTAYASGSEDDIAYLLADLATFQAERGESRAARRWIDAIQSPAARARALMGLAGGMANRSKSGHGR